MKQFLSTAITLAIISLLPQMSQAQEDNCSMKTSDGRVLTLNNLCGKPSQVPVNVIPTQRTEGYHGGPIQTRAGSNAREQYRKGDVTLGNWSFRVSDSGAFSVIVGQVTNTGPTTLGSIKIHYEIYNSAGTLVDTGYALAEISTLAPGESSAFKELITNKEAATAKITTINWRNQ